MRLIEYFDLKSGSLCHFEFLNQIVLVLDDRTEQFEMNDWSLIQFVVVDSKNCTKVDGLFD